jgi:hypothetical protein
MARWTGENKLVACCKLPWYEPSGRKRIRVPTLPRPESTSLEAAIAWDREVLQRARCLAQHFVDSGALVHAVVAITRREGVPDS